MHTYEGGRKVDLPREVGSTPEGKENASAQNAGFLLKELRQKARQVFVAAWGDGPLRPEVMYPVVEHTRPNRAATRSQPVESAPPQGTKERR